MKISLAWVFDHIDTSSIPAGWQSIDIADVMNRFNQTTAEVDHVQKISVNVDILSLARIETIDDTSCVVRDETGNTYSLPIRADGEVGQWYLIKKIDSSAWASMSDVGGSRDMYMPALMIEDSWLNSWKHLFERSDYRIDVDNKSIIHRPDMWGHRGFAREIAALLHLPLKPLAHFLARAEIESYAQQSPAHDEQRPWNFSIHTNTCSRFAAHYISTIAYTPSLLWMAHRLARVDARAMNAIVDTTNYVMFDIGQPMHAFDADALAGNKLMVRNAYSNEQLHILDGQKIDLNAQDIVISDGEKPVALAGVMGGLHSGVSMSTKSIVIESACFDAATIRHTADRHKIRTEASTRFEKSLDPNQNVYALRRFLALLDGFAFVERGSTPIISLGDLVLPTTVEVAHAFIEKRLGVALQSTFVVDTLQRLAFEVQETAGVYHVTIPTFRGTKDISIKEDIVEEVGRYFGYANIPARATTYESKPWPLTPLMRLRMIKNFLAYGCSMRELYNYALYDEAFLRTINWQPEKTLTVLDPVSENWQRLVTSLIPHLIKAVVHNSVEHDQLRFFEFGRVWRVANTEVEEKKLAGIMYDKKNIIDFYDAKAVIDRLLSMLNVSVSWVKVDEPRDAWFAPYQTALLMHNHTVVGIAGKVNAAFVRNVIEGDAFMFELDGDFLVHGAPMQQYHPVSKYPDVLRDVSLFIPLTAQVDTILKTVNNVDTRITSVTLLDFFEKEEWHDKKALAFRFVLRDYDKTMTKEEIDGIMHKVVGQLEKEGATIR